MKNILSILLLFLSIAGFAQTGSINVSTLKSRVNDSTTVTTPAGYGVIYFNAQDSKWRIWNGSAWADIGSGSGGSTQKVFPFSVTDEVIPITTGTGVLSFRIPYAMTLTGIRASLVSAQTSGSILTIDINEGGTTILSTKLTIDNNETTSTSAATAAVISDTSLADDAVITVDIDQVDAATAAAGLKITLYGN